MKMSGETFLYIYGIVKNANNADWETHGIAGQKVFLLTGGSLSAIVHSLREEPHLLKDVIKIKEDIIMHNDVLVKAMEDFGGVIPLKFGTLIVGKNGKPASENLKEWLKEEKERLENVWELTMGKKEYGIRVYYRRKQLVSEAENVSELSALKKAIQKKSQGVAYLLKGKIEMETAELVQIRLNWFKKDIFAALSNVTDNVRVNSSKIAIKEKDDLLLSMSVLVDENELKSTRESLDKSVNNTLYYHIVGPFAPYSFVENEN